MTSMVPEIIDFDHNENILAREPVLRPAKQTFYAIIEQNAKHSVHHRKESFHPFFYGKKVSDKSEK